MGWTFERIWLCWEYPPFLPHVMVHHSHSHTQFYCVQHIHFISSISATCYGALHHLLFLPRYEVFSFSSVKSHFVGLKSNFRSINP
jgi:hypothetical protein